MPKTVDKSFRLRVLKAHEHPEWDQFVDTSPEGSLFSKSAYLDCLGVEYRIQIADHKGEIAGGIVLMRNAFGAWTNTLFAKYLGVMHARAMANMHKTASRDQAVDEFLIESLPRWGVLQYGFHPAYTNWLPFFWNGFGQTTRYTHRIQFEPGKDFRAGYDKKLRWSIKRAHQANLTIGDVNSTELALAVESSFVDRKSRLPLSRSRLTDIIGRLVDADMLATAAVRNPEGQIQAAAGLLLEPRCAYLLLNGTRREVAVQGANALLIDHLLQHAQIVCDAFDFEGSMYARIERFYRRFGGALKPYSVIYRRNTLTLLYRTGESIARRING